MRGPFAGLDFNTGKFAVAGMESKDRPKVTHRGVRVMRHDAHDLTQVDEYPQATGWYIDSDGQLDVRNVDCTVHVVASYPGQQWRRVWFPGAEQNIAFELPEFEEEEESEGPPYIDENTEKEETNDDVPDQYK
jgi:hypothetical protein